MTVQAGIWNLDGEPVNRESLTRMGETVSQFGSDSEITYFDGPLGMLYRAFHTTWESRLEHQPYQSVTGKVLTWDGRLDNREELVQQLRGNLQPDQTDVAIVSSAFDQWGTDCFARLIGDWAMAIWNRENRELLLARDYAGMRHLFYHRKPTRIIWSSHLESLTLGGDWFTLSDEYFAGYLASWPEAHLTPYRELSSVPPGHFVRLHERATIARSYWTFNHTLKTRYKTDAEYEEHFRHLFRQSVRRRLRTDSPVLADLSGGLDFSAIVCMADDILAREGACTPQLDTFSAHDPSDPEDEDFFYFTKVEQKRGRIGHHAELRSANDGVSLSLGKPCFVAIPGFGAREELKEIKSAVIKRGGYRVLLCGTAGDELLGQATDPRILIADLLRRLRLKQLVNQTVCWSLLLRRPWVHLFSDVICLQLPVSIRSRFAESARVEPWFNKRFARKQRLPARQLDVPHGSSFWLPSTRDFCHNLVLNIRERTCTQPAVEETRCPYLDRSLVEFLISLPAEQLLRPGERRSLMRRSLKHILPAEVLQRRTKSTASRYLVITLQKQWNKLENILRSPFLSRVGYVDQERFYSAFLDAQNGNLPATFVRLLRALACELWLREAITRGVLRADEVCVTSSSFEEFHPKTSASGTAHSKNERR
jgi:asparagine synthase (glutamine-hydrolysing)